MKNKLLTVALIISAAITAHAELNCDYAVNPEQQIPKAKLEQYCASEDGLYVDWVKDNYDRHFANLGQKALRICESKAMNCALSPADRKFTKSYRDQADRWVCGTRECYVGNPFKIVKLSPEQVRQKTCYNLQMCQQKALNSREATKDDLDKLAAVMASQRCTN